MNMGNLGPSLPPASRAVQTKASSSLSSICSPAKVPKASGPSLAGMTCPVWSERPSLHICSLNTRAGPIRDCYAD